MIYLNTNSLNEMGIDWNETTQVIKYTVSALEKGVYSQPIKPYLRFNDPANRIIAMPAYVGGNINMAGIKWIASFPNNIKTGLKRAHSVTILNHPDNGIPVCIINSALISGIRTASVSGVIIQKYASLSDLNVFNIGITGFGPIGQLHLQMLHALLDDRINQVYLYDIAKVDIDNVPAGLRDKVTIASHWSDAYSEADIFITCTVSNERYIDQKPKEGALLLNVSLRDFSPDILKFDPLIIVDDWDEVCRENTDIELFHQQKGLKKIDTLAISDALIDEKLTHKAKARPIMFNPMGMAVFDVAIASLYYEKALKEGVGFLE
ncbi:2,3-diaminopropionate biosynthesis protein SbnB [Paenibacillus zanthoxyli]|uniref:2,3-diaminopropionate biosynthesis protein SbnB n=1 Tax=Paenibacillus zanthoxyli TaxID=369399 RepID=UPI0004705D3F|nr:2,3-diaminopropionate biosynthesis protein SbnB [Paenibacillus zanthoxyli]